MRAETPHRHYRDARIAPGEIAESNGRRRARFESIDNEQEWAG